MDSTIVGSVRRWLLDRYGMLGSKILRLGTLNLRPDDPLEVLREVSFARVDRYQRNKDLAKVRTPGSSQKNKTEKSSAPDFQRERRRQR